MNKIEDIVLKARIFLHRVNRGFVPDESKRRAREWGKHVRYEIPRTSEEVEIAYTKREFVEVCAASYSCL